MKEINDLVQEYNMYKNKADAQLDSIASKKFMAEMKDLISEIKKFTNDMNGFGYNISIPLEIYNGACDKVKFTLILSHFSEDKLYLTGHFNDIEDVCYTFDVNTKEPFTQKDIIYLPVLSFVFVQLYRNKTVLLNEIKNAIINEIEKHIEINKLLSSYAKDIKEFMYD